MIKNGRECSRIKGFFTKKNEDVIMYIQWKGDCLRWKISSPSTRRWLDRRNPRDAGEWDACQTISFLCYEYWCCNHQPLWTVVFSDLFQKRKDDIFSGYGEGKIPFSDFFTESTYITEQNKTMPCFMVTKKGCEFIAHKLTGLSLATILLVLFLQKSPSYKKMIHTTKN